MRIIFVRHGQPNYELDCLTEIGRRQAQDAALRLEKEGIEAVYSSPFGRAKETAQATAGLLGLPVQVLPFMHELYWGNNEGKPVFSHGHPWETANELMRRDVDISLPGWETHPLYDNNVVVGEVDRVARDTDAWMLTLGYERAGHYYRCVNAAHPGTVALFSHGGSSVAMLSRLMDLPFPYLCAVMHEPFASISVLRFSDKVGQAALPCLELANDGRHVPYGQEAP